MMMMLSADTTACLQGRGMRSMIGVIDADVTLMPPCRCCRGSAYAGCRYALRERALFERRVVTRADTMRALRSDVNTMTMRAAYSEHSARIRRVTREDDTAMRLRF